MNEDGTSGVQQQEPRAAAGANSAKLAQALACHLRGEPAQAAALCREVLAESPARIDALHLLGVVEIQRNDVAAAVELLGRAIELDPGNAGPHVDLGFALSVLKRLAEALASLDRALALRPGYAKAFYVRGNVLRELRRPEDALESYDRALAFKPDYAEALNNRGNTLLELHRPAVALESYDRVLALNPGHAQALNNRGNALLALKRPQQALASYERALALAPDYVQALVNRGNALLQMNRAEEALASYERALALEPENADAFNNRGNALLAMKRPEESLASYERALAFRPDYAGALDNRGNVLFRLKRPGEALASHERALALEPQSPEALNNRGNALLALQRPEEALASYDRALAIRPDYAEALSNRGSVLCELMRPREALASYERALVLEPEHAGAHWNEALCRLLLGDFDTGWRKYEWRWRGPFKEFERDFAQPLWLGSESPHGKRILLHAEQGLGDTIQFCRYAKQVAALGATVLMETQPELRSLLASLEGVSVLSAKGEALTAFDCHCPLMSLPLAFGTTLQTIPCDVPYLDSPVDLARQWSGRLAGLNGFRIAISWQGRPDHHRDRIRSFPLEQFAGLARISGVRLISLQKGPGTEQLGQFQDRYSVTDLSAHLDTFADTAAILKNMDLVITCDTAVAHLAGALGMPVWVALSFAPEWRWLLGREDSPWYPTMRLFRQRRPGDWAGVFADIEAALRARLGAR